MSGTAMYWGDLKITNAGFTGQYDYNPSVTVTNRPGIINKLTYTIGDHKIVAGYWFEYATQAQTGPFAALNADGSVADPFVDTGKLYLPVGTACQLYNCVTKTTGATVACPTGPMEKRDTLTDDDDEHVLRRRHLEHFAPQWTLEYGVKEVLVNRTVDDYMPGAIPSDTLDNNSLLPTVGVRFKPNDAEPVLGERRHDVPFGAELYARAKLLLDRRHDRADIGAAAGIRPDVRNRPPLSGFAVRDFGQRVPRPLQQLSGLDVRAGSVGLQQPGQRHDQRRPICSPMASMPNSARGRSTTSVPMCRPS